MDQLGEDRGDPSLRPVTLESPMGFVSQITVSRGMRAALCAAVVICILIVVISPDLSLLPTALRAERIACFLLIQLCALAIVSMLRAPAHCDARESVTFHSTVFQLSPSPAPDACVLRC